MTESHLLIVTTTLGADGGRHGRGRRQPTLSPRLIGRRRERGTLSVDRAQVLLALVTVAR